MGGSAAPAERAPERTPASTAAEISLAVRPARAKPAVTLRPYDNPPNPQRNEDRTTIPNPQHSKTRSAREDPRHSKTRSAREDPQRTRRPAAHAKTRSAREDPQRTRRPQPAPRSWQWHWQRVDSALTQWQRSMRERSLDHPAM
ncbi:hypothetical protein GCM10010170_035940 [Dactylosporangium salmoneum]|uniref:Uncharacterized protein n=1 Tax=Dactylosporangium salmoneum TaxID=53361 RepID=A0ABN3GBB1_9ACTN